MADPIDVILDIAGGGDQPYASGAVAVGRTVSGDSDSGFVDGSFIRVPLSNPPTVLGEDGFSPLEQGEIYGFILPSGEKIYAEMPAASSVLFSDLIPLIPLPPGPSLLADEIVDSVISDTASESYATLEQFVIDHPGPTGPQGVPGGSDAATASWVTTGALTKDALGDEAADSASPLAVAVAGKIKDARSVVVDTDYASLELALAAVATGGTLEIRSAHTRTTAFTVAKACTVRFVNGGKITVNTDNVHGIIIDASNVRLENPVLVGNGVELGTANGIHLKELAASPLSNVTVVGGEVSNFSNSGIYIENALNARVENAYVHDVGYGGIMFWSVVGGAIRNNRVANVTMPTGFVNAYGITASRDYSVSGNVQSQNILIDGNTVSGVPGWEGIDTHAGIDITISNNYVYGCYDGIVVIGGKNTVGTNTYAPRNCIVRGNHVESGVTDGSRGSGIIINGVAGSGGVSLDAALGMIVDGNTVVNHGTDQVLDNPGGITLNNTKGAVVSKNTIIAPAFKGINVYDTNLSAIITDNTVVDVWLNVADNGTSGAFTVRGTWNTPYFNGNAAVRGSKTATLVNHRGMYISANSAQPVVMGQNNFDTATTPIADSSILTVAKFRARKLEFTTVTIAGAGGAAQATVSGYMPVTINGTVRYIPFFNAAP